MERLTVKKEADAQRKAYERRREQGYPRNIPEERFLKLAAYEDTGLEPEECADIANLCELYNEAGLDANFIQVCIDATKDFSSARVAELTRAEAEGRLIVLPCKAGDTVFILIKGTVLSARVLALYIDGLGGMFDLDVCTAIETAAGFEHFISKDYTFDDIGKTVFLNREEAEKSVKEAQE